MKKPARSLSQKSRAPVKICAERGKTHKNPNAAKTAAGFQDAGAQVGPAAPLKG